MTLYPYPVTALSRTVVPDGATGRTVITGAVVQLFDADNNPVTMYDNAAGANGSTTKQTDVNGQAVIFVGAGAYRLEINGRPQQIVVGDAALRNELAAPDSTVLVGGRFAREIGYAGDIRRFLNRATNDHQRALVDALEFCRAEQQALYIPGGIWNFEESTPNGNMVPIIGDGATATRLNLNLPAGNTYLFTFTSAGGADRHIGGFSVQGSSQYSVKDNFIYMPNAYATHFSHIRGLNMGRLLNLENAWYSHVSNMLIQFSTNPIRMFIPNGSTVEKVYVQRFRGAAFDLEAGLSTGMRNLIIEYGSNSDGSAGATGLQLRGMESYTIDGLYTEGGMGTEVALLQKNQKACMNGLIRNYWSNSNPNTGKKIHASSVRGLTVTDVTCIVPSIPLIDFSDRIYSDGLVDVGKVTQINPNANGFLGQQRGAEALQPISTNNSLIRMIDYSPKVGNGLASDVQNIAPHTQVDSAGRLPFTSLTPTVSVSSVAGGLTAVSSITQNVFGSDSAGITVNARESCRITLLITGTMTNSSGNATFTTFKVSNSTTGTTETGSIRDTGASGNLRTENISINLTRGSNLIKLAIAKAQGGGGTNTFTVSDFVVRQA